MRKLRLKVLFYLKKNNSDKKGLSPIMGRVTVGKSQIKFCAKMTVPAVMWGSGRAIGKSLTSVEINRQLDGIRASAMSHYRELSAVREKVSAGQVKTLLLGMASGQETLLAYFRAHNENFDKRVGVNRAEGSARSYRNTLNHLTRFVRTKYHLSDIPFTALNKSFIEKFDLYLRVECHHAPGTIVVNTTRLGTIVGKAIAEGIITADPFTGYEPERPERKQKYLTCKELDSLMTTPLTCPNHYLIRDLFLFSCYTGIPYGDMCKLANEDLSVAADGVVWIKTKRKKTGVEYDVPLMELPLQIIERYRQATSGDRLLPMFSNSTMNDRLKELAAKCGIERDITWHAARHTYASEITLSQGVPIETVSRMLGHNRIKTTQIYAKITDNKIDEDMKALEKRIAGQFKFAI